MSAANYKTMDNFPLLAKEFVVHEKSCSVCGAYQTNEENEVCECCGGELEETSYIDSDSMQEAFADIQKRLGDLNQTLLFHKVSAESGYYYGLQLYVEEKHNPNDYDNDDCRYYFDMCRSVAIRRYNSEVNKLRRMLRRLGAEFGFEELVCMDVFSNGEAYYEHVAG